MLHDRNDGRVHRFAHFLHRQVEELNDGGFRALFRKCRRLLPIGLAVSVVLAVRVLRPLVVIRFARLHSHVFGHFVLNTELYLCERDAGMHPPRTFDIFYDSWLVTNQQLRKMWKRVLRISQFASKVDRVNRWLPGYERHVISMTARDIHGCWPRTGVHLSFTAEEERVGREGLLNLGIPDGTPFICFNVRDPVYHEATVGRKKGAHPSFYSPRMQDHLPAIEELTHRGYFALRMGALVGASLMHTNSMIIDYATRSRTDFLDIFLGAKCRFAVSHDGFAMLPLIFRRPVAYTNFIPLEFLPTWSPELLFIPRKLWLREAHRFLAFREILDSGLGRALKCRYDQHGIEVVNNTPEEITALVVEMDERLKGTWKTTEEDEDLQRRFWSLWKPSELNGVFVSRIGMEFLRQNRELLE